MSPFNSPYLTQNNHSKYIERLSGKTHLSNQWRHLRFVKWKYTAREKIGVKVDWFLKIVWKISNLDKSWNICHMGWMFSKQREKWLPILVHICL